MANMRMIGMGGVECKGGGGGGHTNRRLTDLLTYYGGSCPFGLKKENSFCARSSDFYM